MDITMNIHDLHIEEDFIIDYGKAPLPIQDKVDWIIRFISDTGAFPNSFMAHKISASYVWIGYVTRSRQHWRILFEKDEYTNELYFMRLVTHQEMDKILRELSRL